MHKRRSGELVTCWFCKENKHDECCNDDPDLNDVIRCHCSCQPECECLQVPKKFRPSTKAWSADDPRWCND